MGRAEQLSSLIKPLIFFGVAWTGELLQLS